ncbi:hypothetical protein K1719_029413 [Acacia pycnantha]|nr:hypothetical protein K1719_029413 [Acacia pycnantha]
MMNHQGQNNSNESIQSEANHSESTEALGVVSSPSSCNGSIQSFPNSLNGLNFLPYQEHLNSVQSNDHGAGVIHHNQDLHAEYVENGHHSNQNVSVGLCLHPFEPDAPDNQSDSNLSGLLASDSGTSYVLDEQGVDNSLVNMSYLSNSSPEHASTELLTGESSRSAVQVRTPISQAAAVQVNTSNSLSVAAPYIGATNIRPQQSDDEFGHRTIMPVSNMQQLNEARPRLANCALFSFEAGSDHGITRPSYDMLHFSHAGQLGQFQSNNQTDASPAAFVPSSNLSMGHASNFNALFPRQTPLHHQEDLPHFFSQAQASVGAIPYGQPFVPFPNFHDILLPAPWVNVMGLTSLVTPFSPVYAVPGGGNPDNIPRNIMLGPQTGAQSTYPANWNFDQGTANFLGNFAFPSHYGPFLGNHLLIAPTGVHWFNAFEQHMPTLFGVVSAAAPIGFPGPSRNNQLDLNPPAISQERDLPTVINSAGVQNQLRASQRLENQSFLNMGPRVTDGARNNLLSELFRQPVPGLSEEGIMARLRLEEFQSPPGVTPENVDCCCICQENYADGEDIGVLDCGHKFHSDCVKKWLRTKNTCPICVRTGLAV